MCVTISSEIENAARRRRERPSMFISEHQLSFYLKNGFTVGRIAGFFGCSWRTIERRMRMYGISVRQMYSSMCEGTTDCSYNFHSEAQSSTGRNSVDGLLLAEGCVVQRQRIRDALWAADP